MLQIETTQTVQTSTNDDHIMVNSWLHARRITLLNIGEWRHLVIIVIISMQLLVMPIPSNVKRSEKSHIHQTTLNSN